MSATISGTAWCASGGITAFTASSGGSSIFQVSGTGLTSSSSDVTTISFAVNASTSGDYMFGPGASGSDLGNNARLTVGPAGETVWVAQVPQGGSGDVRLAMLTSTMAVGTFAFTLVPDGLSPATGSQTVASGAFNITCASGLSLSCFGAQLTTGTYDLVRGADRPRLAWPGRVVWNR